MKVQLITEPGKEPREIEVAHGTSIEEIYKSMADELPHAVYAAKADNRLVDLEYQIIRNSRIEFLDLRTHAAHMIYQYSLTFLLLKAVRDVLGSVDCEVCHSLNKGLYITLKRKARPLLSEVRRIEARMREMVEEDIPIQKERQPRERVLSWLQLTGSEERVRMLELAPDVPEIPFYELDGYRDFFYGLMTPSTGYLRLFELRKYREGMLLRFPQPSDPEHIPPFVDETKMYQAFVEQSKWDDLLDIHYLSELNDAIAEGRERELIQLSEALHEKKVAIIADMIKRKHKRVILIAGPSSSGKTTFARRLCVQLAVNGLRPIYMGTDDYFVDREDTPLDENGDPDYENLNAVDVKLFNDNINDLLDNAEVDLPIFDFKQGRKVFGQRITRMMSDQILVIEGIHALNEDLTPDIPQEEKFKIYISPLTQLNIDAHNPVPTTDNRMIRRLVRDYKYRGYDAATTIRNWPKVRKGEEINIFPYSGEADVLFNSYHVYELSVLRKYAYPLLRQVKREDPEYAEAQRALQFLSFFRPIEDESVVMSNSLLREFIGGSIFVD